MCLVASNAAATPTEFWEHRATIVAEAEDATTLRATEIIPRGDASGGHAVRWQDEAGRAEFVIRVFTPGTWYVWIRTAAQDHLSNGLFLELDGVRQTAPAGHPMAGTDILYLRKHATAYSWKPEWQGREKGQHEGPIAIEIPRAGVHRLALVARRVERPVIDKVVLTRAAAPEFVATGAALGPPPTGRQPLEGQLLVHPQNAARLARFRGANGGGLEEVMLAINPCSYL